MTGWKRATCLIVIAIFCALVWWFVWIIGGWLEFGISVGLALAVILLITWRL